MVSGALHCTPGTPPRGPSFHPQSTTPWRASLYAGDGGHRDGRFLARFTRMPEIPPRGASFYPQSTFPWGTSLCAGNGGSPQRLSSVVDGLVTRFTVRRGRRRSAAVFIDRRRSHGALHCTPGAQAFCTGARKYWPFGGDPMPTAFTIWGTHYGLGPATHEPPSHLLGVKDQAFPSRAKILGMQCCLAKPQ